MPRTPRDSSSAWYTARSARSATTSSRSASLISSGSSGAGASRDERRVVRVAGEGSGGSASDDTTRRVLAPTAHTRACGRVPRAVALGTAAEATPRDRRPSAHRLTTASRADRYDGVNGIVPGPAFRSTSRRRDAPVRGCQDDQRDRHRAAAQVRDARPHVRRRAAAAGGVGRRARAGRHEHAAQPARPAERAAGLVADGHRHRVADGHRHGAGGRARRAAPQPRRRSEQAAQVEVVKRSEAGMVTDPVTCSPDDTLADVDALCSRFRISGLPVTDGRRASSSGSSRTATCASRWTTARPVREVMTLAPLITAKIGVSRRGRARACCGATSWRSCRSSTARASCAG